HQYRGRQGETGGHDRQQRAEPLDRGARSATLEGAREHRHLLLEGLARRCDHRFQGRVRRACRRE
ncbi:unnamed protein product, partial [Ectocarpus sp. 13 AM-2016]